MALVKINEGLKEEYSMNKTFSAEGEATKLQVLGHLLQDQSLDYLMVVMFGKYYRPPENKNIIYLI